MFQKFLLFNENPTALGHPEYERVCDCVPRVSNVDGVACLPLKRDFLHWEFVEMCATGKKTLPCPDRLGFLRSTKLIDSSDILGTNGIGSKSWTSKIVDYTSWSRGGVSLVGRWLSLNHVHWRP
jgi:hypothetical protein